MRAPNNPIVDEATRINTFRYLNIIYGVALATIAAVTIFSQVVIQRSLSNQLEDSHLINLAGRQRMFSQKITKTCLQVERGEWNNQIKQSLERDMMIWENTHKDLKSGKVDGTITDLNNKEVKTLFDQVAPFIKRMLVNVSGLIEEREKPYYDKDKIHYYVSKILEAEFYFLQLMDDIVNKYDAVVRNKVGSLKRVEYSLMGITLGVLLIEIIFIFQPASRRIRNVINTLVQSEIKASDSARKLNKAYDDLQNTLRQNRDINFALEKATVMMRTDEWGNILFANDEYCAITKYQEHELIGRPLFFNNKGGEESIIYEHIRDERVKTTVWQGEVLDQAKDGANFWLEVTMIPIEDAHGAHYQYLVVCGDVTARKSAESQLQQLNEQKLQQQKDLQRLASHSIITGQEKERKRMAVEIHDGVGQKLTALKFSIEALRGKDEKQELDFENIRHLIYDTIKEVRRVSSSLLPSVITDFGLGPAIKELVGSVEKYAEPKLVFTDSLKLPKRPNRNIEVSLYRIAQEALNNALKHAKANVIQISLQNSEDFLILTVKDDGVGFDQKAILKKSVDRNTGNGLLNMRERGELINAQFVVESLPNLGVIITVKLPLTEDIYV